MNPYESCDATYNRGMCKVITVKDLSRYLNKLIQWV